MLLVEDRRAGPAGVRASIVASKSHNGDGAKGRRKVRDDTDRERRKTPAIVSEETKQAGEIRARWALGGTFGLDGTDVDSPRRGDQGMG